MIVGVASNDELIASLVFIQMRMTMRRRMMMMIIVLTVGGVEN